MDDVKSRRLNARQQNLNDVSHRWYNPINGKDLKANQLSVPSIASQSGQQGAGRPVPKPYDQMRFVAVPQSSRRIYPQKQELTANQYIHSADTQRRGRAVNEEIQRKNSFGSGVYEAISHNMSQIAGPEFNQIQKHKKNMKAADEGFSSMPIEQQKELKDDMMQMIQHHDSRQKAQQHISAQSNQTPILRGISVEAQPFKSRHNSVAGDEQPYMNIQEQNYSNLAHGNLRKSPSMPSLEVFNITVDPCRVLQEQSLKSNQRRQIQKGGAGTKFF